MSEYPTSFTVDVFQSSTGHSYVSTFTSPDVMAEELIKLIELLPDEMDRANVRVGLMLRLRHTEDT